MGHGKETPRQKMIGMMYLVLTALLALNVSKDVLEAFVLIDDGLNKTTLNFVEKNQSNYDIFEAQMDKAAAKVGPFRDNAHQVKKMADQLTFDMQEIKVEIIKYTDGEQTAALKKVDAEGNATKEDNVIDWYVGYGPTAEKKQTLQITGSAISSKDNMDKPSTIMIVPPPAGKGKGAELKTEVDEYREFLLSLIDEKDEIARNTIEDLLHTGDHTLKTGEKEAWEIANFAHLPLVAVITNLSKLQSDVRTAEAEVVKYLLDKIGATDTKVNKMEAIVLTKSNYVLKGNNFEARVLLAAYDSLQKPEILIGKYRRTEDGYEMVDGGTVLAYDAKGRAMLVRPGSSVGNFTVEGLLNMQTPEGLRSYPFSSEYQVGEANAVISATKMNVLYIGVENPISISVSGVPADKVRASITRGTLSKKSGSEYVATIPTGNTSDITINVSAEIEGAVKGVGSMLYRVKMVPPPVAKIGGKAGGNIEKNVLTSQTGILADMEDFLFDLRYVVSSFTMTIPTGAGDRASNASSAGFTDEQKKLLNGMTKGQRVFFTNIKARGPDGTKDLRDIMFTIQ